MPLKGNIPWNKGKKDIYVCSEKTKRKTSLALLGKKKTTEHARHIGDAKRGIHRTPECIRKMSETSRGKHYSSKTEFKPGLTPWNKGMAGFGSKEKNGMWQGGRYITGDKYIMILKPEHPMANKMGYVAEHRLVAEEILGRPLTQNEIVHHVNRNKQDNRKINIKITSRAEHINIHRNEKRRLCD